MEFQIINDLTQYIQKLKELHDNCQRIAEKRIKDNNSYSAEYWQDKACHIRGRIRDLEKILNKEIDAQNLITEESLKKWRTRNVD